eukprot:gnl/TRDRNA2_/TRDRNA2_144091_c0_seq1.p1 gnl/TRDRNA2_/TRDRNA2_144091_c0~~gnl/TRDRNA2_/TRDRNA2_144091_c0_seq1.p1  ORF type:complete len:852 (-),score=162.84 gnl/TRDRNA2_/TRDRNA2_144091_c0_seq1:87-2606(-)
MVVELVLAAHATSQFAQGISLSSVPTATALGCGIPCAALGALVTLVRKKLKSGGIIRPPAQGPLAGIKVVDSSVVIAGPFSAKMLSELGAEVVKVEVLALPDSSRGLGTSPALGMAGCTAVVSQGKQSIILDVKEKSGMGLEAFRRLIKESDVFIENFRPGATTRMGISYEELKKINPNLIYVSSSGFGQTGPYASLRIYDPVIQVLVGAPDIQKDTGGVLIGQAVFDKSTAHTITQSVIAALVARDRGAGGQHIDISMQEVALHWMFPDALNEMVWGAGEGTATSNVMHGFAPPAGPVLDQAGALASAENKPYITAGAHALFGEFLGTTYPVYFPKTPLAPRPAAPMLGEHTAKLLSEMGFSHAEMEAMLESKAAVSTKSLLQMKKAAAQDAAAKAPAEQKSAADAAVADLAKKIKVFGLVEKVQGGNHFKTACLPKVAASALPALPSGSGPMSGVKVLDASDYVAGPLAACTLGDQGADVIKVEQTNACDSSRGRGPCKKQGMGAMFMVLNRNKRSVALDATKPQGKALLEGLAAKADIVIVDVGGKLQIDYGAVSLRNPQVIFVEIQKGAGELKLQASSGLCALQFDPNMKRVNVQSPILEKATGMYAASAAGAALFARSRGAGGQRLQVDMLNAALHFSMPDVFWNNIWKSPKASPKFPEIVDLYKLTQCKDGTTIFSACLSDKEWQDFCAVHQQLTDKLMDEATKTKYKTMQGRLGDISNTTKLFEQVHACYTYPEYEAKCTQAGTVLAKLQVGAEALNDRQVQHKQTILAVQGSAGSHCVARPPARLAQTPPSVRTGAPLLGEHTAKALEDWGFDAAEVKSAVAAGAAMVAGL